MVLFALTLFLEIIMGYIAGPLIGPIALFSKKLERRDGQINS